MTKKVCFFGALVAAMALLGLIFTGCTHDSDNTTQQKDAEATAAKPVTTTFKVTTGEGQKTVTVIFHTGKAADRKAALNKIQAAWENLPVSSSDYDYDELMEDMKIVVEKSEYSYIGQQVNGGNIHFHISYVSIAPVANITTDLQSAFYAIEPIATPAKPITATFMDKDSNLITIEFRAGTKTERNGITDKFGQAGNNIPEPRANTTMQK